MHKNEGNKAIVKILEVFDNVGRILTEGAKMATKSKIRKALPRKKVMSKKPLVKKAGASLSSNGKKAVVPFVPTKLKLLRPLPSDIEIAQAGKLKPILQIAAELSIPQNALVAASIAPLAIAAASIAPAAKRPNGK